MKEYSLSVFCVSGEKRENLGEDAYIAKTSENRALIGVFDGCGGIGSKKYECYDNKSGAYIASRKAKEATEEWFEKYCRSGKKNIDFNCESLKKSLKERLERLCDEECGLKGDMAKSFPTTVSAISIFTVKNCAEASFFWAGDSRGYIFERDGLVQITRDDISGGGDAMENLREDARLSNYISGNGNFSVNKRYAEITEPCIFLCATDGCFGYLPSPMEFEYLLCKTMCESESVSEWKNRLKSEMEKISGDDFSLAVCIFGYDDFRKIKKTFKSRRKYLEKQYISPILSGENTEKLWKEYKDEYYG